ncbi:hypothetical protein LTS10_012043 [Elasticomyces elasticus]|nr:hypothetical protein LTS10_012043 [Elasticomyces elasticus]
MRADTKKSERDPRFSMDIGSVFRAWALAASSRAQSTSRYGVATHQLPRAGFGFSVSAWPLASVRTVTPSVGAARAGGLGYGDDKGNFKGGSGLWKVVLPHRGGSAGAEATNPFSDGDGPRLLAHVKLLASDDSLAVGSDGTEVTNPFSDGEGNGGARLYDPCGQALHVPRTTNTRLSSSLSVLDKFIQYGEVYGAVFNHFDQTTQTLKPYAMLQFTNVEWAKLCAPSMQNSSRCHTRRKHQDRVPRERAPRRSAAYLDPHKQRDVLCKHTVGWLHRVLAEEIVMVIKHAETPHRSPFAQRAIIRVYESHISTLQK